MSNPYGNPGYRAPMPPQQVERVVRVPRDSGGMATLRVIAYLLTSLASLLFIVLVIYGYIEIGKLQTALDGVFKGGLPQIPLPTPR